ncbi:ABC transporter transmembrane domain-containing protein [Spirobacillus cienkowskii]|uniref:ABC transporter transmembrane domain-containing protein n=1 Tax=Spirobacillus cienkowskii TaxID=495820 RepID=UPI0030D240C0
MKSNKKFLATENRNVGKIGFSLFYKYLKSMQGYKFFIPIIFILIVFSSITDSGFRYIVSLWIDNCANSNCLNYLEIEHSLWNYLHYSSNEKIIFFFFLFCLIAIILKALHWMIFIGFLSNGARVLHDQMVESFSNVRVTFIDENPTGRLIHRFSGDYNQAKNEIPNIFVDIFSSIVELLIVIFIVIFQAPFAIFSVLPCIFYYYKIQQFFTSSYREIQRYSKTLETPIWSIFTETISGYQTIRAYGKTNQFLKHLQYIAQDFAKASLLQSRILRWLNLRLKFTSECFALSITLIAIYFMSQKVIGVGRAGFLMSLTIGLDVIMQWLTRSLSLIESKVVSIERIIEYKDLPSEHKIDKKLPGNLTKNWPNYGEIIIDNLSASYREDLPMILNHLSIKFHAGKKTGIIGKTGAGKSSIFQAFYRMLFVHSGKIIIDNIDIHEIPLEVSRSIFAIVPQEPHLFSGTLRYNLDRLNKFSDQEIWQALTEVQLAEYIKALPNQLNYKIQEKGENFSVGQRQLICMARAILSHAKVILMDEATASVDYKTETLIQHAIHNTFAQKTIIIIAHRLETLKTVDHVVLLGNGQLLEYGTPEIVLSKLRDSISMHLT